jgi:HD-GYP domain-containing protein (c-di-GMP phosphodiesterase class II)
MNRGITVNLGNLVLSLSDAMDLASPKLARHQQRTAFITWEVAKAAGLSENMLEKIFISALLHDIGALSVEEKVALHDFEIKNTEPHCIRGKMLLARIPWLKDAAKIVRFHHRECQDWNKPINNPLVLQSQILFLADYLERLVDRNKYILHQNQELLDQLTTLSGNLIDPQVVEIFALVAKREEFWLDLVSPRLYSILLHEGPYKRVEIDLQGITLLAELFRNIIDFRSRFTSTHSSGVAACAKLLAEIFGLTEMEVQLMQVAGNLHDLGKLAIPNSILEKPDTLTKEEFAVMKSHTYYTYSVLNTIGNLKQIAEWAAYHHEKLDGSGYPFHCSASELNIGARIMMVADIFTALAEKRPYKAGKNRKEINAIMLKFANKSLLDPKIVELLFENYDEILSYIENEQTIAREFYEKQFAV